MNGPKIREYLNRDVLCYRESFGLSHEDAKDRDKWRLRIKGGPVYLGLPENGR